MSAWSGLKLLLARGLGFVARNALELRMFAKRGALFRALVSARTVPSFSASLECGSGRRLGRFGAQRLYSSAAVPQIKSKRMTTSASSEPQADSRQYFALTYGKFSR